MTEHCIIRADFSKFLTIAGRKVAQIILEVPIEDADEALAALGGFPHPGKTQVCAIARLTDEAASKPIGQLPSSEPKANGSSKKFHELPLSQQAVLRCKDALFQEFMGCENEAATSTRLKDVCGVKSRRDLDAADITGRRWFQVEDQYQSWLTDRKFAEAKR